MNEFFLWQNLIFLAPLAVGGFLYVLLSLVGGMDHGDVDADAPLAGHEADLAHEVDVHSEVDLPHDGAFTHGHAHEASEADASLHFLQGIFWFFGIGKAPLGVIVLVACFLWAVSGFLANQVLGYRLAFISIAIAACAVIAGTGTIARYFGRLVPSLASYSQEGLDLWGCEGVVRFTIRRDSGAIQVADRYGNVHLLECRLSPGQPELLPGTKIRIDDFDNRTRTYTVISMEITSGLEAPKESR